MNYIGTCIHTLPLWNYMPSLSTDNGLEFCGEEFNQFCRDNDITRHRTMRYTLEQNGVVERLNRMIMERVRCQLSNVILDEKYLAKVVAYTLYILDRCLHTSLDYPTPKEKCSKHPPNLDKLRVFGCIGYVHENQGKLNAKETKSMFVSFT